MFNNNIFLLWYQFWEDFWPNFASTVFGLLLGLPIALWTNKKLTQSQDQKEQQIQKSRLVNALQIIRQALGENNTRLLTTIATIKSGRVQFDTELDISAWDAVRDDISNHLDDPNLKRRIAYHFSRLATMSKLNSAYLDFSAGIASAIGGVENTKNSLYQALLQNADFLMKDISEISLLIEAKLAAL